MAASFFHVGFTGTRDGMTVAQRESLMREMNYIIITYENLTLHHGACVGDDEQFSRWYVAIPQVAHPCNLASFSVPPAELKHVTEWRATLPPLVRNRQIVEECELLIACPKGNEKADYRSGTWATIRYARKQGVAVYTILPNGTVFYE